MLEQIENLRKIKSEFFSTEENLENSFRNYYRTVIRKEDKDVVRKLSKVPDNWEDYVEEPGTELTDTVKYRLSDVKKRMSWEIKVQSLYLSSVTTIEKMLINYYNFKVSDSSKIEDAINSINFVLMELDDNLVNIKHLILSLAKRSISDCYYLICSYTRFYHKKQFEYEKDIRNILNGFIERLENFKKFEVYVEKFLAYEKKIDPLFIKSSNRLGWRLNEAKTKDFFESDNSVIIATDLYKVSKDALEFKNKLREKYLFLKYYYNETDGKEFRLNFIKDSIQNKLASNIVDESVLTRFDTILGNFKNYKVQFHTLGLHGFGPERFMYIELLQFLFKICKIVEFFYLRNMQYDKLKEFRDEIQLHVENEIYSLT